MFLFSAQSENNETRLEMDLSQDSAEGQDGETCQQSFMSSSDVSSVTSMAPTLSSMQPIPGMLYCYFVQRDKVEFQRDIFS